MSERSAAIGAAGIAALFFLAGCSGPPWTPNKSATGIALNWYPPWTLHKSPDAIALRWYPDTTPSVTADQVAQLHCRSWDRSAELASDTRDGSAEIAQYRCR